MQKEKIEEALITLINEKVIDRENLLIAKKELVSLKKQLAEDTRDLTSVIAIDPEQLLSGKLVKLSNQPLRDSFIAENTKNITDKIDECYFKINTLTAKLEDKSDMILFYDIITRA